ncbi:hypothetical protein IFM89_023436 [Coptis chinensis]|uniref:Uncharacterized protein n=1 Tax=Coptis chinensis TaxID=261450 RepID=A0A835IX99_9MAGN|nr:hypothetical protein IFM89_023436 [Coptis chinensis]
MTLLEIISKASNTQKPQTPNSTHPIIFNSEPIFSTLQPSSSEQLNNTSSLIKPIQGWKVTQTDEETIKKTTLFCKKLKRKLKNTTSFTKDEFLDLFTSFLEKNRKSVSLNDTKLLVRKMGFFISPDISSLVIEGCFVFEDWGLLEILISEGVVGRNVSVSGDLIERLIEKKRTDLLCVCVKHFKGIQGFGIRSLLKYFISPPKGAGVAMGNVRKEWEREALLAIEKASDESLAGEKLSLAKQASILLMVAYDEFTSAELCLHYLFASSEVDELTLSYALSGLDGSDMLKLIRYFGKWVRKYKKFTQAGPCPSAASVLGLGLCDWVPSLEAVVKYLGLVLDEQFSSLVLYAEFHDELRSLQEDVDSLALETRFCCSLVGVVENLKLEIGLH